MSQDQSTIRPALWNRRPLPDLLREWARVVELADTAADVAEPAAVLAAAMREHADTLDASPPGPGPFVVTPRGDVLSLCCEEVMTPDRLDPFSGLAICSGCQRPGARWSPDGAGRWLPLACSELDACRFGDRDTAGARCSGSHGCHGEAGR